MDYLSGLNDKQQLAVTTTEGTVRVIAGAGSGKTRALSHRYAYLVNEVGVDPASILCLTFTNKAAQEMKQRVAKLIDSKVINDFICTIHGFCVKFLREEIFRLGYPATFQVLDEEDVTSLIKQVLEENNIDRKTNIVNKFRKDLAIWKSMHDYIGTFLVPDASISETQREDLMLQIVLKQRKYFSLDFNDLIHFTLYILDKFPEVKLKWQKRFNYVMVDEVQDCTQREWTIFRTMSDGCGNLFVVGDPDQAIYEWRGAMPDIFVQFKAQTDIIMAENYRSTSCILDSANSVIEHNKMRVPKDLFTRKGAGDTIIHFHAKTELEESTIIAKQIKKLLDKGCKASDFAILYRASYLSRSIEQALMKESIGYTIWGGIRFFERKEIKDCLSYLRLIASGDDISFARVCNEPSRKLGKETFKRISEIAKQHGCTLFDALKWGIDNKVFAQPSFTSFVKLIEDCRQIAKKKDISISALVDYMLNESGLMMLYRTDENEERLENLQELIQSIKLYEQDNKEENITLDTYLQDIALYTNADYKNDGEKAKLMTIHQSKGLEFPFVFIVGLSEGIFPSHRAIRERKEKALEEERRLMYVAITRAQTALFLTESEGFNAQSSTNKYPSRFIREIKENLYITEGEMENSLWEGTEKMIRQGNGDEVISSDLPELHVNDIVSHKLFGEGIITACEENNYYRVSFPSKNNEVSLRRQFLTPTGKTSCPEANSTPTEPRWYSPEELTAGWHSLVKASEASERVHKTLANAILSFDENCGRQKVHAYIDDKSRYQWIKDKESRIEMKFQTFCPNVKVEILFYDQPQQTEEFNYPDYMPESFQENEPMPTIDFDSIPKSK